MHRWKERQSQMCVDYKAIEFSDGLLADKEGLMPMPIRIDCSKSYIQGGRFSRSTSGQHR